MNRNALTRWLGTLAIVAAGVPAAAQQQIDDVNIVVPQRRVLPPRIAHDRAVQLRSVDARVTIVEQVASTELRFTLRNPGQRQAEAQLLMPVPDGAVVKHFELEGLGEQGIARVLPRDEARRIYDEIVRRSLDPGLLEFAGYNLVRSSVFPVPAGGEQKVRLVYEQVLPFDSGRIDYVLPRSESLETTGVAWSFALELKSSRHITAVYSPSHDLVTERINDSHVKVKVPESSAANDVGALRVSYLLAAQDGVAASLIAYPDPSVGDGQGGYFLMLVGVPPADDREPVKREVTIVIDRSGSMRGEKMEQARESARQIVEALDEGEAFNIIDYSNDVAMFSERPVRKNAETIAAARRYIAGLTATGGTNIHDALLEALRQPVTEGTLPMVLFLTDGLPTIGVRSEVEIREAAKQANVHNRRIFTFGVGVDVNAPLLNSIARSSRATSTFVLPDEDVEVKVGQVFRRLSGPVLASPELTVLNDAGGRDTRAVRSVLPAEIPDVFEGDQVVLLGQYTADRPLRFKLIGEYFGRKRSFEFTFGVDKATTKNSFVPRLWASRQIGVLLEELRAMGANGHDAPPPTEDPRFKELIDEIVRLSTKWGVLTEYTAFLAVEPGAIAGGRAERERLDDLLAIPATPAPGRYTPPDSTVYHVEGLAQQRAMEARSGAGGVNQDMNLGELVRAYKVNAKNAIVNADLQRVELTFVRQVSDKSFYRRGERWVDASILDDAGKPADETVEFGTKAFDELVDRLVKENRQGVLALGGEVYFLIDGKRVLVTWPGVNN